MASPLAAEQHDDVSKWGRQTYGDPCAECGFSWSLDYEEARLLMESIPSRYRVMLAETDGSARLPDLRWSALGYVCHVTDNLRTWAERLAAAALGSRTAISPYDADLLAVARRYGQTSVEGALWSLERAVGDWLLATKLSHEADARIQHCTRGEQTVLDVVQNNIHDALHHEWDIARSIRHKA